MAGKAGVLRAIARAPTCDPAPLPGQSHLSAAREAVLAAITRTARLEVVRESTKLTAQGLATALPAAAAEVRWAAVSISRAAALQAPQVVMVARVVAAEGAAILAPAAMAAVQAANTNDTPRRARKLRGDTERVGDHGYPDASHHPYSCSAPWRGRVVRSGTLVLGDASLGLQIGDSGRSVAALECIDPVSQVAPILETSPPWTRVKNQG